ncbi:GFA family protein [Albimonas sp. CAU 1670]|uniref:GFA family protein n=1 Tax=Albimonas sp. CAU 1670 TaxID=3032599 RepID=UPI0023DBBC19|nr:GFA family protein [Albimonas sp. CAU 1670]MDF2234926.1 GFA family protein [Albimonas sp. CAU 1670]
MSAHSGRCTCGQVRFRLTAAPMIVHCCHCSWCRRETGSAFVLNAVLEASAVEVLAGEVETVVTPSASGKGQRIDRCPVCRVAVWSVYSGAGPKIRFVRVGTLDAPERLPPDVHIFTSTALPWLTPPPDATTFAEYYDPAEVWSAEARARWRAARDG